MSRPRSLDKSIPLSIAIPMSLHFKLSELIPQSMSRSQWICRAINNRINEKQENKMVDFQTLSLMCHLRDRKEITNSLRKALQHEVDAMMKNRS